MANDTLSLLYGRKSVRAFEEKEIPEDIKQQIYKAMIQAPTAGNSMLYSVIDVTEQKIKEKLAETCDHQPFIGKALMVWVFLADYRRWIRKFRQAGCEDIHTPGLGDFILAANDTIIAAHTACVAAESLGIGSCYIGDIIENWEIHQKLLSLPYYVAPISMLVFGYPTDQQKARPQPKRFPQDMVVFKNRYHDLSEAELLEYMDNEKAQAFYIRKYVADFSLEMNRSAEKIVENWSKSTEAE